MAVMDERISFLRFSRFAITNLATILAAAVRAIDQMERIALTSMSVQLKMVAVTR